MEVVQKLLNLGIGSCASAEYAWQQNKITYEEYMEACNYRNPRSINPDVLLFPPEEIIKFNNDRKSLNLHSLSSNM